MLNPEKTSVVLPDGGILELPLRHLDGTLSFTLAHWNSWVMPPPHLGLEKAPWVIGNIAAKMNVANRIKNAMQFNMVSGPPFYVCTPQYVASPGHQGMRAVMRCLTPSWIPDYMHLEHVDDRLHDAGVLRPVRYDVLEAIQQTRNHARLVSA